MSFIGGVAGAWQVQRVEAVVGDALEAAPYLSIVEQSVTPGAPTSDAASWVLRGATSSARYTKRSETEALVAIQAPLKRPHATGAALIPIRKTEAWWSLAQDERRAIFEEQSKHIAIGIEYLPGVARRLHHSRDLGEPFDFLTWFEFAPEDEKAFEDLVGRLRMTPEWRFVDREVDIRLRLVAG